MEQATMAILKKTKTVAAQAPAQKVQSKPQEMGKIAPTESKAVAIPQVKAGAMSVDLGPMIAKSIAQYTESSEALQQARMELGEREYAIASAITEACVKATRADPSIDFSVVMGKDIAAKRELNAKMYIALGLKTTVLRGKEGQKVASLEWNPNNEVGKLLGEQDSDSAAIKQKKESYRTNLSHTLTKCEKAALWLVETKGVNFTHDKDSGTLRLSGPGVQQVYGAPTVLLNQSATQPLRDADGKDTGSTVNLKAKPSYTDIARRAAEAHGKVIMTRADSRPKQFDDPHAQVVHMCELLVKTLEKYSDPNPAAQSALESALSAIEETLG
jgi:hypothetical protein